MGGPELIVVLAIAGLIIGAVWSGQRVLSVRKSQEEIKRKLDLLGQRLDRERPPALSGVVTNASASELAIVVGLSAAVTILSWMRSSVGNAI